MAEIISFITELGGVGKSSLCYNLAWSLASKNKKVLIIDMDAQGGNVSFIAGVKNRKNKPGIYDVFNGYKKIEECIVRISPNLSIVPANEDAALIEKTIMDKELGFSVLRDAIRSIPYKYDYIFLDANPTPSAIHIISFIAAEKLILTLMPDPKSVEGTEHILTTYDDVKDFNEDLEVMALVYNRYKRTVVGRINEEKIRDLCERRNFPIAQTKLPENVAVSEAVLYREGVTTYAPKSKSGICYEALTKELFGL